MRVVSNGKSGFHMQIMCRVFFKVCIFCLVRSKTSPIEDISFAIGRFLTWCRGGYILIADDCKCAKPWWDPLPRYTCYHLFHDVSNCPHSDVDMVRLANHHPPKISQRYTHSPRHLVGWFIYSWWKFACSASASFTHILGSPLSELSWWKRILRTWSLSRSTWFSVLCT